MTSKRALGAASRTLESLLAMWEDTMCLAEARQICTLNGGIRLPEADVRKMAAQALARRGAINNWRSFRKYLLGSQPDESAKSLFDYARFGDNIGLSDISAGHPAMRDPNTRQIDWDTPLRPFVPRFMFQWAKTSRRVFSLTADLQALCSATSLQDVNYTDVEFPFDAFAVNLSRPITGEHGEEYGSIWFLRNYVMSQHNRPMSVWMLVSTRAGNYTPLSDVSRQRLLQAAKNWPRLKAELRPQQEGLHAFTNIWSGMMVEEGQPFPHFEEVEQHVNEELLAFAKNDKARYRRLRSDFDTVAAHQGMRIVVSMCLYLQSLPSVSPYRSEWQKVRQPHSAGSGVAEESQVCELSSQFVLSDREREVFVSSEVNRDLTFNGQPKSPHFRRGYWRRPRGEGHNPEAKKTVWVHPTVVNLHLLKEGELPRGAEAILTTIKR